MAKSKVGILGDGHVGSALARGIERAGYVVAAVGRERAAIRDTAGWADLVILAVPFGAIDQIVEVAGEAIADKPLVDVSNALGPNMSLAVESRPAAPRTCSESCRGHGWSRRSTRSLRS